MIYFWALLLVVVLLACWVMTLLNLPGNWVMVGVAALYALAGDFSWWVVGGLLLLAGLGELIETAAGALGAKKAGGSRRGAVLAIIGAMGGSVVGAVAGLPIPVPILGPVIGVMLCASIGATLGAMLGEYWKGRNFGHGWKVGVAAFWSRFFGTMGKLVVGAAMVAVGMVGAVLWVMETPNPVVT